MSNGGTVAGQFIPLSEKASRMSLLSQICTFETVTRKVPRNTTEHNIQVAELVAFAC